MSCVRSCRGQRRPVAACGCRRKVCGHLPAACSRGCSCCRCARGRGSFAGGRPTLLAGSRACCPAACCPAALRGGCEALVWERGFVRSWVRRSQGQQRA
eukprot:15421898-Heterocapsa_arctica.AAC.1